MTSDVTVTDLLSVKYSNIFLKPIQNVYITLITVFLLSDEIFCEEGGGRF